MLSMISASTVLLATSNLRLSNAISHNFTKLQCNVTETGDIPYCPVYNVLWAWCLFLMICVPYGLVFIRCLYYILYKRSWRSLPGWKIFLFSMGLETLNAIGLALMAFMLLPHLNNAIQVFIDSV